VIAKVGAWINLFNLTPFWQLDGARGFRGMSRTHRVVATAAIGAAFALTGEGLLVLVFLAAAAKLFGEQAKKPDARAVLLYVGLIAALAALADMGVGVAGR